MNSRDYLSLVQCKQEHGHYALFATIRLHTAVIRHDRYTWSTFKMAFRYSGKDHENDSRLQGFMENLDYADSHYFTTDELRFYVQAASPYRYLTNEEIENERHTIERERETFIILDSHADYLIKAMDYWILHFKDKFQTWRGEFSEADEGWILRRKLADGDITQEEVGMAKDEGYYSEGENGEDENSED
jgi:hypothetical protein